MTAATPSLGALTSINAAGGSSTARRGTAASGKDFNALLHGRHDASRAQDKTPSSAPATNTPARGVDEGRRGQRHAAGEAADPAAEEAPAAHTTAPADADAEPAGPTADDPTGWPPSGLAGLILSAPLPANEPAITPPLLSGTDGAAGAPAPAPGLSGMLAASAATAAGAVALPTDAVAAEALEALPEDLQAAVAAALEAASEGGDAGVDAPEGAPVLLHGLQQAGDARPLHAGTAYTGEPTPVPSLDGGDFDDALGARIGWLADQKIGHAHIRLRPDDLGTVDVRLQLDGDKVHASFSSPHVDVRHALEGSLPRLRELLGEQGFQLAHADVGQHGSDQTTGGDGGGSRWGGEAGDGEPAHETVLSAAQLMRHRGLLDTYA